MKKFFLLFSLLLGSQQSLAVSPEMTSIIVKFVVSVTGQSITTNYSNNMRDILQKQCGGTNSCSDRTICQIINLGAVFPMDCSGFSDIPVAVDPSEVAFNRLLASLPEPASCVEYYKGLTSVQVGQLQINIEDQSSMPGSTLGAQCLQDKKNLRLPYFENKEEILRMLGYPLSDLRIDQIFQRVLGRNPTDVERTWTRDFNKSGGSSQDIAKVLYLSLDLIGANGRTISLENIYFQYLKQNRDIDKVVEILLGIDKTVYTYTWNDAEKTCNRSPRPMVVKNQKCGKSERQIQYRVGYCEVSYDGEYRFTLKGGQDECPESPEPLSGPLESGIYLLKNSYSQKCLDVRDASQRDGARLQQQACSGKLNQAFSLNNISGEYYTVTAWHSQQCITSESGGITNGNPMIQNACSFARSQNVRLVPSDNGSYQLQLIKSGLCLDVAGLSRDNGKDAIQSVCSNEDDQDWNFVKTDPFSNPVPTIATDVSYEIINNFSEKCLDVKDGLSLQQWQCSEVPNQIFRFQDAGQGFYRLKASHSGKCVRAEGGKNDNGVRMILGDCNNNAQDQKIRLEPDENMTYKLRFAHSNRCVDVAGTTVENGKEVHQWDCGTGPDQKWLLSEVASDQAGASCEYKHKEATKGGKKGETNFFDAFGGKKSCDPDANWKTSCKDGDGKTDEVSCRVEPSKTSTSGFCQYKHKKDTAGGKQGQINAFDAKGKSKACDKGGDWKTSCKDGNGDTDEVSCL